MTSIFISQAIGNASSLRFCSTQVNGDPREGLAYDIPSLLTMCIEALFYICWVSLYSCQRPMVTDKEGLDIQNEKRGPYAMQRNDRCKKYKNEYMREQILQAGIEPATLLQSNIYSHMLFHLSYWRFCATPEFSWQYILRSCGDLAGYESMCCAPQALSSRHL